MKSKINRLELAQQTKDYINKSKAKATHKKFEEPIKIQIKSYINRSKVRSKDPK